MNEPVASRRAFLATVGLATASVTGLTAGQTVDALHRTNVFGPRVKGVGPQSLPINQTAAAADVEQSARDPRWRLTVVFGSAAVAFGRKQLLAMPQTAVVLPIACVEGWSAEAHWRGVRLRDLLVRAGAPADREVQITSLQLQGAYRVTSMGPEFVQHDATLVALIVNGETLDLDHGYPARIIAPARPGVLQTKWLSRIEVSA